jgi:hypothetical protein
VTPPSSQEVARPSDVANREELTSSGGTAKDVGDGSSWWSWDVGSSASSSSNMLGVVSFAFMRRWLRVDLVGVIPADGSTPPRCDDEYNVCSGAPNRPEDPREPQRLTSAMSSSRFSAPDAGAGATGRRKLALDDMATFLIHAQRKMRDGERGGGR